MLAQAATLDELRAAGGPWSFERKLDGLRCIAVRDGGPVTLWSRNRLSFTGRFPALAAALGALAPDRWVLDGEVAAFDGARDSFAGLQAERGGAEVAYCAFDVLSLLGRDVTGLALEARRPLLAAALAGAPTSVRTVEAVAGEPAALLDRACADGWEGLVAKRPSSPYRPGRSPAWRKLKCLAGQELVVGGWTEPGGARTGFGALLVGWWDGDRLRFAGKVGTGFDERTLRSLHGELRRLEQPASPFADAGRIPRAHWARPELVAEVRFTEWTADGRLRHPSFAGLRPDTDPRRVVREPPSGRSPRSR